MKPHKPSQHASNLKSGKRAERALKSVKFYMEQGSTNIGELITDLRHYCDTHQLDYGAADVISYQNYVGEVNDPCL